MQAGEPLRNVSLSLFSGLNTVKAHSLEMFLLQIPPPPPSQMQQLSPKILPTACMNSYEFMYIRTKKYYVLLRTEWFHPLHGFHTDR